MKHFIRNEFKKLMTRSCFVALTAMAVVLWSPQSVIDNLQNIWDSPDRLTAIEADINRINESLAMFTEDENRTITLVDP